MDKNNTDCYYLVYSESLIRKKKLCKLNDTNINYDKTDVSKLVEYDTLSKTTRIRYSIEINTLSKTVRFNDYVWNVFCQNYGTHSYYRIKAYVTLLINDNTKLKKYDTSFIMISNSFDIKNLKIVKED
jgi:hypothetical protein